MIHSTLKFLAEQVNQYLEQFKKSGEITTPVGLLANISRYDEELLKTTNNLIISLVNISEEFTMKNMPHYRTKNNETVHYENPPLNLNLYILFASCYIK